MKASILVLALLLSPTRATPQQGSKPIPQGVRQADRAEDEFEKSVPAPRRQVARVDLAKLRGDAAELAALAQTIPSEVDSVTKGLLPQDVIDKLKRVENLSKRLRSELAP